MDTERPSQTPKANELIPSEEVLEKLGFFQETREATTKIKDRLTEASPENLAEMARFFRRKVYLALKGGFEQIAKDGHRTSRREQTKVEGMERPMEQENSPEYTIRARRWRTFFALKAILNGKERECIIGEAIAKFREAPNPDRIVNDFFDEKNRLKRNIDIENMPFDICMDIIALTEDEDKMAKLCEPKKMLIKAMAKGAHERLIKALITDDPTWIKTGREYFTYRYYDAILKQSPTALSEGRIGRKAAGVLLAYAILQKENPEFDGDFLQSLRKSGLIPVGDTDDLAQRKWNEYSNGTLEENHSLFIGSSILHELVAKNRDLFAITIAKYIYEQDSDAYEKLALQTNFENAEFPEDVMRSLLAMYQSLTKETGDNPSIGRSSSELEDRSKSADGGGESFAGRYASEIFSGRRVSTEDQPKSSEDFKKFLEKNPGFKEFIDVIKKVFGSAFSKEVMQYRMEKGLMTNNEEMGILVQRLNGNHHGKYFYPDMAGVALSATHFSPGPDPSKGSMTIVLGLGNGVVDGRGHLRWLAAPNYKLEGQNPQTEVTVFNTATCKTETIPLQELIDEADRAKLQKGHKAMRQALDLARSRTDKTLFDFGKLVNQKGMFNLPTLVRYYVKKLERVLGPVDVEFTVDVDANGKFKINIVQCRPHQIHPNFTPTKAPSSIPENRKLFEASSLNCGKAKNIEHILYIDPHVYDGGGFDDLKRHIPELVRQINDRVSDKSYYVMAPGRWGDNQGSEFGVGIDISAYSKAAGVTELSGVGRFKDTTPSNGSHAFQNMTNSGMLSFSVRVENESELDILKNAPNGHNSLPKKEDGPDIEIPDSLKPFVKWIPVQELGQSIGLRDARMHVALSNGEGGKGCIYFAEKDKDLPEATEPKYTA
ncbi:MAG: PEP/pyruvate-binding domain-containing protein [Candidatus Gracilibacteria bacterium]